MGASVKVFLMYKKTNLVSNVKKLELLAALGGVLNVVVSIKISGATILLNPW